jgi:tetratricopeptide (TPR) repeat protein
MILPLDRARLLPCHVQISLAAADLEAATQSIEELEEIARQFGAGALEAAASHARGSLELAKEHFEQANRSLERALKLWLEIDLPYEAALSRLLLAETYRGTGDETSADLEQRAARSTLAKLGSPGPDVETQIG